MPHLWAALDAAATALVDHVAAQVTANLAGRAAGPRNEAVDDAIFAPLNVRISGALQRNQFTLALRMYRRCMEEAYQYEDAHPGMTLHKATPAFNAGLAHLRAYDFEAALHYFELAQREMRLTTGNGWNIFNNPAFHNHFWMAVEGGANVYPLPLFQSLWGVGLTAQTARRIWMRLSRHSKMPFVLAQAERIRLRQLVDQSRLASSRPLALAYWHLIGDLLRLLETEVQRRAFQPLPQHNTLHPLLSHYFTSTRSGNLSAGFLAVQNAGVALNNTDRFNARFDALRTAINDETRSRNDRIYHAVYLFYGARNQVQHHVDRNLILFRSLPAAMFMVQVLLCLCRLESWARRV